MCIRDSIVSSVRFDKAIKTMQDYGIDTYVEIGPGKTLTDVYKRQLLWGQV